jgi:4-hydroxy-tetrahydrodipicolinate synthase
MIGPSGIVPMLYAFFGEGGSLRLEAFAPQVEAAVRHGADGVAVLGLGTEAGKLKETERAEVLAAVVEALSGRLALCVTVGGADGAALARSARAAQEAGAASLLFQPPPEPVDEAALIAHFAAAAAAVDIPAGVQNAPEFLGYGLDREGLLRLADAAPNIRAVKAETSAVEVERLVAGAGERLAILNGRCGLELPDNIRAGVAGMIPSIETVDLQTRVWNTFRAGDTDGAEALFRELAPVIGFAMQGIPHFLTYGKLLAAHRLGLAPCAGRSPRLEPTRFGEAIAERFAARLGPL